MTIIAMGVTFLLLRALQGVLFNVPTLLVWLLIGLATGGAWVFYFQDAPTLWADMLRGQFYFVPTFWMVFLTFSTYIMAGFAREQVCTYMCPWPRIQAALTEVKQSRSAFRAASAAKLQEQREKLEAERKTAEETGN